MFRTNQEGGRKQVVVFPEHSCLLFFFLVTFQRNTILHLPVTIELRPSWPNFNFLCRHNFSNSQGFFFSESDQGARVALLVPFPESSQNVYEELNPWPSGIFLLMLTRQCLPAGASLSCRARQVFRSSSRPWFIMQAAPSLFLCLSIL